MSVPRKKLNPLTALLIQATPKTNQPRVRKVFVSQAKYWAPQSVQIPFPYVQSSYVNTTYVSYTN